MAEPDQLALHAAVPPGRVFGRQPQRQGAKRRVDGRAAGPGMCEGPVAGDQPPVPAHQGGRGDEERRPPLAGQEP
jgi:hypothetical protein